MNRRAHTAIALSVLLAAAACMSEVEPEVGEVRAGVCKPEDHDPEHDVSFEQEVLMLLTRTMGGPGCSCHLPTSPFRIGLEQSKLDLSSYAGVMSGGQNSSDDHVVPGDPCASILVQKVSSAPPFGARMPSNGPPYLSLAERQLLHDWIAEGAREN
jgi:hypothetical protein